MLNSIREFYLTYFILREIQPSPLCCDTTCVRPKTTGRKTSIILEVLQTPLRKPNVPNRLGGENGRHNLSVSQSEARQGRVQNSCDFLEPIPRTFMPALKQERPPGHEQGLSRKLWSGPRVVSTDCEAIVLIAGRLLECEVNHSRRTRCFAAIRRVTTMERTDLGNTP